jgi:hypothetical protein
MLNLIKEALAEAEATRQPKAELDNEQLLEFAHVFNELDELSINGNNTNEHTGLSRGHIDIPINDDIEIESLEINVGDGRVTDIPSDASVQESIEYAEMPYSGMMSFDDFYQEGLMAVTQFPREPYEKYEKRVMEYARAKYAEYDAWCFQEGAFGRGKIDIGDPAVPSRLTMNFGPRNPEKKGDSNHVITAKILYETDKKGRVTKKQIDTANIYNCPDHPVFHSLYEPFFEAIKKRYKVPKNKGLWDVANVNAVFIPVKPTDQWTLIFIIETDFSNEKIYFQISIPIKRSSNKHNVEDSNIANLAGNNFKPGFKMLSGKPEGNFRTAAEVRQEQYEMNRPSRFGRSYSEAIDLGDSGGDTGTAPDANAAPAADANAEPSADTAGATPPPVDGASPDAAAAQPDTAENVDVNDVSDQIAANVAAQNDVAEPSAPEEMPGGDDMPMDPAVDGGSPEADDLNNMEDPTLSDPTDVSTDPALGDTPEADMTGETEPAGDDMLGGLSEEEMNNMSIEELIERGSDKLKSMSINQLKAFLTSPEGTSPEDVQEAAWSESLFTRSDNVKQRMSGAIRNCIKGFGKIIKGIEEDDWGYREFTEFWGQVKKGTGVSGGYDGDDWTMSTSANYGGEFFGQRVSDLRHYVHIAATKKRTKDAFTSDQRSRLSDLDSQLITYIKTCDKASSSFKFRRNDVDLDEICELTKKVLEKCESLKDVLSSKEVEDSVIEEAAIITKKNIKGLINDHMKSALGILNDTKRDFQTIVKDFKAESKAMNKTLTKALKMKKIFTSEQLDQLSKLNHAVVDLASGIEINNKNESYTAMIKEKIKAFAAQCKVVSKFTDAKAVTESGCCGAAPPEVKTEDDELTAPATAGSTSDNIEGSDLGGVETDMERTELRPKSMTRKARDDFSIYQAADHQANADHSRANASNVKNPAVRALNAKYADRESAEADALMSGFKSAEDKKSHKPMDKDTRQAVIKKAKEDLDPKLKHSNGRPVTKSEREDMAKRAHDDAVANMKAFNSQYDSTMRGFKK